MNNSNASARMPLILVVIGILAIAVGVGVAFSGDDTEERTPSKYVLYMSMDLGSTPEQCDEFESYVMSSIVESGYGYTKFWAEGGYVDGDKVIYGEQALIVVIAFTEESFVDSLVNDIKEKFDMTVMVEKVYSDVEII